MSEVRYVHSVNGQEVEEADLNLIANTAGLVDDHILAELLRLAPFSGTVAKAILPYGTTGVSGAAAIITAGTGAVTISPFRAIIGSRTAVNAAVTTTQPNPVLDNWRDLRSGVFTGPQASGVLTVSQTFVANASGNPRWDLVYAAVSVDANGPALTRYAKDPASSAVTPQSLVTTLTNIVAIGVVAGTPAASPTFPAVPSDAAGNYYIPLAYVRIVNGFTGATVLNTTDIVDAAPVVPISRTTGAASLVPANQNNVPGGTVLSSTAFAFTGASGQRPSAFIPPTMIGKEEILIYMDLQSNTSTNWSHQNGAIVDNSRDWSKRLFKWTAFATNIASYSSAWDSTNASQYRVPCAGGQIPSVGGVGATTTYQYGMGQSLYADGFIVIGGTHPAKPLVLALSNVTGIQNFSCMPTAAGTWVTLYVDTGGVLKVFINGAPTMKIFIWLDATAPFPSY